MKITLIHLVLLFVLCLALPFLFRINRKENIANYPSSTDLILTDASYTDASFTDLYKSDASYADISFNQLYLMEGMTNPTSDIVYSTYDQYIDADLVKEPGNSVSEYLRNNPIQCDLSDNCDEFLTQVDNEISIVTFFKELYNKYNEGFTSHTLKDEDNNTYTLDHKEKLVNDEGILKESTDDLTRYGDLLTLLQGNLNDVRDNYSEYVRTHPGATTTVGGTTYGTEGPTPTTGNTNTGTNDPASYNSTYDVSGSEPTGVSSTKAKCIADFGTNIGDPLCCGQGGTLQNTKYVCPNNQPTCSGYKCGSNFGTCS